MDGLGLLLREGDKNEEPYVRQGEVESSHSGNGNESACEGGEEYSASEARKRDEHIRIVGVICLNICFSVEPIYVNVGFESPLLILTRLFRDE